MNLAGGVLDYRTHSIIISVFLLSTVGCFSQSKIDSTTAGRYYSKADFFWQQTNHDSALHYFDKAAAFYKKAKVWRMQANCLNRMSEIFFGMIKYEEASACANQAIAVSEEKVGKETEEIAYAFNNLGKTAIYASGDYDRALDLFKKAIDIERRLFGENHKLLAESYCLAGGALNYKNDYQQALEYYKKSLSVALVVFGPHNPFIARISNNTGMVYSNIGEFEEALKHFRKSIAHYNSSLFDGSPRDREAGLERTYSFMGAANYDLGRYRESLFYFEKSFSLIRSMYGERSPAAVAYYRQIGDIHQVLNNFNVAASFYKKALNVADEIFGPKHPAQVSIYTNMSMMYATKGNYNLALQYLHQSIVASIPSFNDTDIYSLPAAHADFQDYTVLFVSLNERTRLLQKMHEQNGDLKSLKEALRTCQLMDTLVSQARRIHINFRDKAELGKVAITNYENGIKVSLKLHSITNEHKFLEQAFYFSESNKAGILREALQDMAAKGIGLIPDSLVALENKMKEQQIIFQSRILKARSSNDQKTQDDYQNKLFALNRSIDSLKRHLETDYPGYYEYKYQNDMLSVADAQKSIPIGTLLIEFFEGNEELYVFALTSSQLKIYSTPADSVYEKLLYRFRNSILTGATPVAYSKENFDNFCTSSYKLYDLLLNRPLTEIQEHEKVNTILVIPDGLVSYIPLDVLLTKNMPLTAGSSYAGLNYLLNDYTVNYGYSAHLSLTETIQKEESRLNYIAFAPQYGNDNSGSLATRAYGKFRDVISSLKWNQEEVRSISEKAGGKSYTTGEATENRFKKEAGNFGLIHLAMHAVVDEEDPMNSSLVFTVNNDPTEDGLLHAFELYNMQLNAQMAVLSACNTGYGKLVKGEGIMSLARAFSYAGVPSVVMSHWRVDDEATSILMQYFYDNLDKGMTKSEALRQAKLLYLRQAKGARAHPFYWGAFLNIGKDSPVIFEKRFSQRYVWIGLLSLAAFIALVAIKKRKINQRSF